ncbi:putative ribonuclease H-like domain-containing protein [Tanacetum coccineum]
MREYSVARTPQQNGVAERRNMTLIKAARTMLADSKLPTTFWAEAVSTACYVQNRVLVVKPYNKTPYELFRGFKPALSFMRPFGCHVTILNTLDSLGKFDGKSDEGFFVGYSLSIAAGTITNESACTQGELNAGTSTQKEEISQDCIMMPIWKDASYFDSPSKDVGNGDPKSAPDDQKQVEDGPDNENDKKDMSEDDSSPKEVNTAGQHVNTASPEVNTSHFKLNTVNPSVNTASSSDPDSPKDMFTMGASYTLEVTHVEFFNNEDEPEVDLGNILNSYTVPTTPNIRIHKDHPIKNVIGDVKSSIQTRSMTKPTSKQWFLSVVYEQKTHDTLNTYLYACFLSQIKPTSIAKALSYSGWKQCMKNFYSSSSNRNKASLVAQGHRQEEEIDNEEVFAHVARIEAIRLFLAYASFMGFLVYQIDVKSAFLYGTIKEEFYVDDIIFGSRNKELYTAFEKLIKDKSMIRYLKGKPTLGLWYSRDSPFELVAYTNSDYAGATQDRKSTTGGCQFLGNRLISWQCKKQTVVATSTTEAEYVAAASCCGQVLWIQNQLLDYGYNFMNTMIHIDNNSTICIIENPVQHSKTKHIEIRHHFIRDCNAKKLIQMVKIDTEHNVADLLTKGFDAGRHVKRGRDTKIPQSSGPPIKVGDEAVHKELGNRMERAATIASSLEAEQDSGLRVGHGVRRVWDVGGEGRVREGVGGGEGGGKESAGLGRARGGAVDAEEVVRRDVNDDVGDGDVSTDVLRYDRGWRTMCGVYCVVGGLESSRRDWPESARRLVEARQVGGTEREDSEGGSIPGRCELLGKR